MRKIAFGTSLLLAFITLGCANSQMHQSLLMHENRRLEDALYVAHAQLSQLKQENDVLRGRQTGEILELPTRSRSDSWWDDGFDFDSTQPFEMPTVILPDESETSEVPDVLKGSQTLPIWSPVR